jgi:hypothetical protein
MFRYIAQISIFLVFVSSCNKTTEEDKMLKTSNDIVLTVRQNEFAKFRFFIGPELDVMGKDDGMVYADFSRLKLLLGAMPADTNVSINMTDLFSNLGQRVVEIPIKDIANKEFPDRIYHLYLFFGPTSLYSLDKISGYKLTIDSAIPYGFYRKRKDDK